ncbi:MAG: phenylalanine--tRNA ligase subunit alpha [Betaproteobacteria bacterium TMED82]|nr:MAG: phenylalanine--tRNA ligase subunit alpha [Betaproteobacteria bacterium TMED82]
MNSENLNNLVKEAKNAFRLALNVAELENAKAKFLGKSGALAPYFEKLASLEIGEKKELGKKLNKSKLEIEKLLVGRRQQLKETQIIKELHGEEIDPSLPGRGKGFGGWHPLTTSLKRIEEIFQSMSFRFVDGPEIETDWYNFTALNNPKDHPARSMQDTFYINNFDSDGLKLLLRTHTSPVQVRYASKNEPPIRIISYGKTYRVDSDATHSPMFHQIEGLWIGENVNFGHLKGLYKTFLKHFFETEDLELRFRPSFFPFTEPSAEIDIKFSSGKLQGTWLEVAGAGQVHPSVIRNFGFDPEEIIGFAFGTGLERLTMIRHGITDLRLFYENDLRFLRQF